MFKNIFVTNGKLIGWISEMLDYRTAKKRPLRLTSRHASLRPIKIHDDDCRAFFFEILERTRPVASGSIFNLQSRWLNPRALPRPNGKKPASWATPAAQCADHGDVVYVSESALFALGTRFFCDYYRYRCEIVWLVKRHSDLTRGTTRKCCDCVNTDLTIRMIVVDGV